MTTSVACKTLHVSPPPGQQYIADSVGVIVSQNGCVSNDQGQVLSSEINLMEMTEVEYTHLQRIIQSHIEAQAAEQDGSGEIRLNPPVYTEVNPSNHQHSETNYTASSPPSSPPVCQHDGPSSVSTDVHYSISGSNHHGQVDLQEIKMVLVSDPVSNIAGERTPTSCGEVPGSVLAKVRCAMEATRERGIESCDYRGAPPLEARPNPPARVRLEKRFNCSPCDIARQQDSQSAVLNTFLTMLHHSTEVQGIAMHSQSDKWIKSDRNTAVECAYPYGGSLFNTMGASRAQGHLSQILEGNTRPELIIPKNFTFSYRHDKGPATMVKAPCVIRTDPVEEHVCVKLENEAMVKPAPPLKRTRTRGPRSLQAPNIIQGNGDWRGGGALTGNKGGRRGGLPLESSQRRERHNSKERDRRRRIRLCCDELNHLVPFCNAETDKATTLQWTTAFLKYIREVYGDTLKQDFQSTFCGKTGVRIKPSSMTAVLHTQPSEDTGEPENGPHTSDT